MEVDELLAKIVTTHGETQEVTRKLIKLLSLEHKNCGNHHGDPNIALSNILAKVQHLQDVLQTYKINYDIFYDKDLSPPVIRPSIIIDSLDSTAIFDILGHVDGYPTSALQGTIKKKKKIQCTEPTHSGKCCNTCNHSCRHCKQVNCKKSCPGFQVSDVCHTCNERRHNCKKLSKVCCDQCNLCLRCGSLKDESAQCTNTKLFLGLDDAHLLRNLFGHLTKEKCKQFLDGKCLLTGFKSKNVKELEQEMIQCVKRTTCFLSCKQNFKFNTCMTKEEADTHVERIKTIWQNDMTYLNKCFAKELLRGFEDVKSDISNELVSMMENVIEQLQRLTEGQKQMMKGQEEIKREVHDTRTELQSGQNKILSAQRETKSMIKDLQSAVDNTSIEDKNLKEASNAREMIASISEKLKNHYKKVYSKIKPQQVVKSNDTSPVAHDDIIVDVTLNIHKSSDKTQITMKELISKGYPYTLIYGDPGIGKTTLMKTLAYKWAIDDFNIESDDTDAYDFVFLLFCRKLDTHRDISRVEDYLNEEYPIVFDSISLKDLRANMSKVLLILEGFDEPSVSDELKKMSESSRGDVSKQCNVMYDLLVPDNQELPFDRIVTSRTSSREDFLVRFNNGSTPISIVEVVGFSPEQMNHYLEKYFCCHNDSNRERLLDAMSNNDYLCSLARYPFFCWALCSLYKENQSYQSPQTLTAIYASMVLIFLRNHGLKNTAVSLLRVVENEKALLSHICRIAFLSLSRLRVVFKFSDIDLPSEQFEHVVKRSGLVEIHSSEDLKEPFFQFIHLSIHEFLASLYILTRGSTMLKKMESEEYKSVFIYPLSLQFLAGFMGGRLEYTKSHEFVQQFSQLKKGSFVVNQKHCVKLLEKSENYVRERPSLYYKMLLEFENNIGTLPKGDVFYLASRTVHELRCLQYLLKYVREYNKAVFPFKRIDIDFEVFNEDIYKECMQYIHKLDCLSVVRCRSGFLIPTLTEALTIVPNLILPHCGISREEWECFADLISKAYQEGKLRLKSLTVHDFNKEFSGHSIVLPHCIYQILPLLLNVFIELDADRLRLITSKYTQSNLRNMTVLIRCEEDLRGFLVLMKELKLITCQVNFYHNCEHKEEKDKNKPIENKVMAQVDKRKRIIDLKCSCEIGKSACNLCILNIQTILKEVPNYNVTYSTLLSCSLQAQNYKLDEIAFQLMLLKDEIQVGTKICFERLPQS